MKTTAERDPFVFVAAKIPAVLLAELDAEAAKSDVPNRSGLIREALRQLLENRRKERVA